jgi:hypothetical protein
MRWYQYLIPTYGNWGGPGWSGGRFENDRSKVNWATPPVDEMDQLFKDHDNDYQHGMPRNLADAKLLYFISTVNVKGIWPNCYRIGVQIVFGIKLLRS